MSEHHVTKEHIGKCLGRIPSGVAILTTQQGGQKSAMLVSWFQQVSFEPPMVVISVKQGRATEEVLRSSEKFVLNILHTNQKDVMSHFGKGFKPEEDPFAGVETKTGKTGIPTLKNCLCFLECQVRHTYLAGDHNLFLGEVINGEMEEEGQPMVHVRRNGFNY